ncbi:FAD:protein FMN transferase [Proteobacteria bacterium 005FR1]|nr:FAD:protein FMN transferase [Proteobacteria bacterium 005FR1]
MAKLIGSNLISKGMYPKARQRSLLSLLFLWLLVIVGGCEVESRLDARTYSGQTMGTTYNITVVAGPEQSLPEGLEESISSWLAEVNQSMSTYLPESELSQLKTAPVGEWIPVSPMLAEVIAEAQSISDLSGGAFDVSVGPLVELWGFGPVDTGDQVPSEEALSEVRKQVGYQYLQLRSDPPAIKKTRDISIDLSAIAKGFGADYVGRRLSAMGFENYLVEIGGDLLVSGRNAAGEPWRIGVEKPAFERKGVQQAIVVVDAGVATSGDYRNFFRQNGQIYSHIIDPRLGRPVQQDLASVTVIAESAARADGLATAFTVMGADEALSLAEEHDIPLYMIVRRGENFVSVQSEAFTGYLD